MDVSRASPFSFARFLPYSRSCFSVVVLCRVSCPFPVFPNIWAIHEARSDIQVKNTNNKSAPGVSQAQTCKGRRIASTKVKRLASTDVSQANMQGQTYRKDKRQMSRKHRRLASKRLKEIQRDLQDARDLKGFRGM